MSPTELRWILLGAGLILLVALYLLGRQRRRDEEAPGALDELEDDELADADAPSLRATEDADPASAPEPLSQAPAEAPRSEPEAPPTTPAPEPQRARRATREPATKAGNTREMIVVLHVVARAPATLSGPAILQATQDLELEYGEMQVFNRVIERSGSRRVVFSVANMLEPGTFDLATMDDLSTRGLSLFMRLPGPQEGLKAFNEMVGCAQRLAGALDADLLDETHSALTQQTIDHMREEIQLFSLRTSRGVHG